MSAIVGLFGSEFASDADRLARSMFARLRQRGSDRSELWTRDDATLAVARTSWELASPQVGSALLAEADGCIVAADASLYYRDELKRGLASRGVSVSRESAADLILATYRAWGAEGVTHLEGDFAFILWDTSRRRLLAARDFVGLRPLFFASVGSSLVVASSVEAIVHVPGVSRELNLASIAEDASGVFIPSIEETCYRHISRLGTGRLLEWQPGSSPSVRRHWEPPIFESPGGPPLEQAAEELRDALVRATGERSAPGGITAIWMSGGYDSTTLFGAGMRAAHAARDGRSIRPISIRLREDDPEREEHFIEAAANYHGAQPYWIDDDSIPAVQDTAARAAARD